MDSKEAQLGGEREEILATSGGGQMQSQRYMHFVEVGLRLLAIAATFVAAIVMGTDKQTIRVFGAQLKAKYNYSPAFLFFVVANAIAGGYALLSLPITLLKPKGISAATKFVVFLLDLVMVALVMAGASAATAIAYVGHKGNSHTQWLPICNLFDRFCDRVAGALLPSFIAVIVFMLLTLTSTLSLFKHSGTH